MNHTYIKNNIIYRHNTWDESIWNAIHYSNEYNLDHNRLHWKGDVIDIGGHIGSFSHMLYKNGANKIFVVEPDEENFAILSQNLAEGINSNKIILFNNCISYSSDVCYKQTGHAINTGGNSWTNKTSELSYIPSITLDQIIDMATQPIFLKIDCEGCEFEILSKCQNIYKVSEVVGEWHGINDYSIRDYLKDNGFIYASHTVDNQLGLFGATRKDVFITNQKA